MTIDSFVMSCRALGRGIEIAASNTLKQFAFDELNAKSLRGRFIPTRKNKPAADFYERQQFETLPSEDSDAIDFSLLADAQRMIPCPGIQIDFTSSNDE